MFNDYLFPVFIAVALCPPMPPPPPKEASAVLDQSHANCEIANYGGTVTAHSRTRRQAACVLEMIGFAVHACRTRGRARVLRLAGIGPHTDGSPCRCGGQCVCVCVVCVLTRL